MAAEIADGWLPIFFAPKSDAFYRAALEEGFARPGARHSWDDFEVACTVPVIVGDDVEGCADFLRPMMALYIGGMGAQDVNFHFDVFARLGHEEACHKIQDAYLDGRKRRRHRGRPHRAGRGRRPRRPARQDARRARAVEGHRAHDDARVGPARTPRPDRRARRLTWAEAGDRVQPLAAALSFEPTVTFATLVAGMSTGSPVCGFRPVRALRCDCSNVRYPGIVSFSPPLQPLASPRQGRR